MYTHIITQSPAIIHLHNHYVTLLSWSRDLTSLKQKDSPYHILLSIWIYLDWPKCISVHWKWRMGTRPWTGGLHK